MHFGLEHVFHAEPPHTSAKHALSLGVAGFPRLGVGSLENRGARYCHGSLITVCLKSLAGHRFAIKANSLPIARLRVQPFAKFPIGKEIEFAFL